jgi:DNA mismatch endonuclease (patch repair protein)
MSTDVFTPVQRAAVMRAVKGANTAPELRVRKLLWSEGFRYRLNVKTLPGKPDIVFRPLRSAIFVHGCFWHGHDCRRGARMPKANNVYWKAKIERNRERDIRNAATLKETGWRTLTIWECQMKDPEALRQRLLSFLT